MNDQGLLPLAVVSTSLVAAAGIFLLREHRHGLRIIFNLAAALVKLGLVILMALGMLDGGTYECRFPLVAGVNFLLRVDALGLMFTGLSSVLWLFTTIYAIGYRKTLPTAAVSSVFSACASPAPWVWHWRATSLPSSFFTNC
jgi:multicomponent Na+:H+ antiporter subunit D